ncbi:peptidylprolyl isomerase [Altererythrobacter sp. CAU 1778]
MNSVSRKLRSVILAAAATAVAVSAPAIGQQVEAESVLDLPASPTVMGNSDPNFRRATAKINGAIITGTDVDQRMALVLNANQDREIPEEELARLRGQVLRNLIDETLQIQAARLQEIEVAPEEVQQSYARVARDNFGSNAEALDQALVAMGSSPASLKRQIEGEMAWNRLQRRNITPFVDVSEDEVNDLLARLNDSRGTEEYRLGEIYLASTPATRNAVQNNALQIVEQLKQGGSFLAYARQYSEASTKSVGGDLGWLRLGQLPAEIGVVAREMQPGQLVGPIEVPGGYSIVVLMDKRQILTSDPRDAILSLKQISIDFTPGATQAQMNTQLEGFRTAVGQMRGCGQAEEVAASIGGEVVTSDQVVARQLPAELQQTLLQMQVGQSTPPFGSVEEGVRVLMLCGRDDPQMAGGPSPEQLREQLKDERVAKWANRYLRDLRRDAIIEYN